MKTKISIWQGFAVGLFFVGIFLYGKMAGQATPAVSPANISQPVTGDELPVPASVPPPPDFTYVNANPQSLKEIRSDRLGFAISLPYSGQLTLVLTESASSSAAVRFADSQENARLSNQFGSEWNVVVGEARNDAALLQFIRKQYAPTCTIKSKLQNMHGQYDVQFVNVGVGGPSEGCGIDSEYKIKYAPGAGKVATWDIGQDHQFALTKGSVVTVFDETMSDSFRFLNDAGGVTGASPVTAAVVWKTALDPDGLMRQDIITLLHECGGFSVESEICVTSVMKKAGASAEAIDFYQQTGWFADGFHSYGVASVIGVVNPWRANGNSDYIIADSAGEWFPVETGSDGVVWGNDTIWDELQKQLPKFSIWPADESFVRASNNRLVFQMDIKNEQGCHACSSGYAAHVGFDFDDRGHFTGAKLLSICAGDEATNEKHFPICSLNN